MYSLASLVHVCHGQAAPAYFRKAILESGDEWSQHRKLYETKGTVRGSIPPGFSYFCFGFGVHSGYATVIENSDEWPRELRPSSFPIIFPSCAHLSSPINTLRISPPASSRVCGSSVPYTQASAFCAVRCAPLL